MTTDSQNLVCAVPTRFTFLIKASYKIPQFVFLRWCFFLRVLHYFVFGFTNQSISNCLPDTKPSRSHSR